MTTDNSPRGWVKVPTGGDHEPAILVWSSGSPRTPGRQPGADQVRVLGRRSESGWERVDGTGRRPRLFAACVRCSSSSAAPRGRLANRGDRARRRGDGPSAGSSASAARRRTAPNPWVGCVLVRDGEVVGEGATATARAARHAEVAALRAAGDARARRDRVRHARAVRPPRPHAAVRRRARSPPASRASSSRSRIPTRASPGAGFARLRAAGIDVDGRRRRRRGRDAMLAPYLHHRRTGRPFVVAKVAIEPRRPRRRRRRHVAVDHVAKPRAPTRTSCAPTRRRSSSASGTALADQPVAHRARRRRSRRAHPPLRVAARRARPRARDRSAVRHRRSRRRSSSPPSGAAPRAVDAWRAAGAKVEVVAPRPTAAASISTRRSRCSDAKACCRCSSKAAARCSARVLAGGHAQRLVAYVAPLAARRRAAAPASRSPGPRHDRRRAALRARRRARRSAPTSASTTRSTGRRLMFTGIVEELGRVRSDHAQRGRRAPRDRGAARARRRRDRRRRSRSTAAASPSSTFDARRAGRPTRSSRRSPARTSATCAPGDPVNLERPVRLADRLGGHLVQGHVDGDRHACAPATPQPDGSTLDARSTAPADVLRYVVHKGSITVDGISLTVAAVDDDAFAIARDPAHARGHDARHPPTGRAREPRSRSHREVRRTAAAVTERKRRHDLRRGRTSHRRGAARRVRRRRRRRGSRERGRPHHRGREDDAREDGVHDPLHERRDLPADGGRAARRAAAPADGRRARENTEGQRTAFTVSVDAKARHDHRHLRRRPQHDGARADRPATRRGRSRPARPHLPAALPRGRRAQARRPHRGRGRPRPARRAATRPACSRRS